MNANENNLSTTTFFALWFGAAVSMAEIFTGGLLAPLGFKFGLLSIFAGHLIGCIILILGGIIGTEKRIPSIKSTRISFGSYGSYLFSIFNVLQLIGWTTVMIISGARSLNFITSTVWGFDHTAILTVVIGGLICLWIFLGKTGFNKINTIAAALLVVLTVILSFVIFNDSKLLTAPMTSDLSFGAAMELNIIMPLSWLPLIADYTRFAKSKKGSVLGSFTGYFIGSCWMYSIGLATAIITGNADPSSIMLASNLGFLAAGIILLSTVTTTFLDAYSAGVTFLNVFPKLNEKTVAVIMAIIGTVLALIVPMEQYENFLYAIGSVFAPLFAILLTDYFILKERDQTAENNLLINWSTAILWLIGIFLYYRLINIDLILGTTVPVMLLIGILRILYRKVAKDWKLQKKL